MAPFSTPFMPRERRSLETRTDCQNSQHSRSTNPDNQRFYHRQGFKALKEVRAPNGGPVVVLMLREPRAAKPSRRWTTRT